MYVRMCVHSMFHANLSEFSVNETRVCGSPWVIAKPKVKHFFFCFIYACSLMAAYEVAVNMNLTKCEPHGVLF